MKIFRKLILSVLSLVAVVICFAATTYAWFDVNSEANVTGFDFTAISGEGFLVSVDGVNYSNDLTTKQMQMAMIQGYNPSRYTIENNNLYQIFGDNKVAVSDAEINEIVNKNLLLYPVTSKDGINFTNLVGTPIYNTSGKFIEFSIYFKAASDVAEDNYEYDIYVCGDDITLDSGVTQQKTIVESVSVDTIALLSNMTLYDGTPSGKTIGPELSQNYINVYTSNALRFSINDTSQEDKVLLYELTNESDLGSYATNYNGDDPELNKLYNSKYNAGFTYYNNLRPYSQLTAMNYENKPKTIRTLQDDVIITSVKSGSDPKLLTFRFWLEGWDADCFDGLAKSIIVKLLFNSKRVTN